MKKPDKPRSKQSSGRTALSHKELVAKITEENRIYFKKKGAVPKGAVPKIEKQEYPPPYQHLTVSEIGTTRQVRTKNPKSKIQIPIVLAIVLAILVAGGIFAGVLSAIFLPGAGTSLVAKPPPPNYGFDRFDEWNAAKHFIQAQYPGAQTFSGSDDSTVQASTDGTCIVAISVGGVNAFNAPLRDTLTVIMKFQGGRFGLQRIDSQNEAALVRQQIKDGY
ncbi:MAG TPA: hypothetical protein DCQ92_16975 [Verrucomicrobia subdivision 3 bacterium]|nr:hypothetical protein [Limisphaerales bacterium]